MNVLGIIGFGKNPGACLLQEGKLISLVEEERFSRLKSSHGMFPARAVSYCLSSRGLRLGDIDRIAFGWDCTKYPWRLVPSLASGYLRYRRQVPKARAGGSHSSSTLTALSYLAEWHPSVIREKIHSGLRSAGLSGEFPKIEFVPHHLSHAYSTYFCSGFKRAGILTIDGSGEDVCTQLAVGEDGNISLVESFPIPHSLGWFYAAITQYLGFVPYRDEGKVMGLAALGEDRKNANKWLEPLSRILRVERGSYEVNPIYTKFGGHFYGDRFTDELAKLIATIDATSPPITYGEKCEIKGHLKSKYLLPNYVDIAWAAQELLERAALTLATRLVREHGVEDLCIAGGVGLNCKMNGEILHKSGCKNIFVQPASNDSGSALGAAMYVSKQLGYDVAVPLKHVYYGPSYSDEEIHSLLKNCKIKFRSVDNPAIEAANLLEQGRIIGWFNGGMEFGARALGARSILANPLVKGIKDKVNNEVKYREDWRPFCPSLQEEAQHKYLKDVNEASFMIVAYQANEKTRLDLPSVVHVDGTIRPQVVSRQSSPLFYSLLEDFGKRCGEPIVLNTSFNVRGEPIVCTPQDAFRCFFSTGLDSLIMGSFLLQKGSS